MLDWHEECLKNAHSPKTALNIIRNGNHDINQQDELGMTLLMYLVTDPINLPLIKTLIHSSEATITSLRRPINLNVMNKNGEDAFLLASAAHHKEIVQLLNVEEARRKRIQERRSKNPNIGYHETSGQSYKFIMNDLKNHKFPMIGGAGGYFGGGIYFAVTKEESTTKALHRGYGFECQLKMGNVYKISSKQELNAFRQTYFNSIDDRTRIWYQTPSDVIRMRLLTYNGKSYDSVWGHYEDTIPSIQNRILPTGDEYVVYSADQLKIENTFILFNKHWLPNNLPEPHIYDNESLSPNRKIGDVLINHADDSDSDDEDEDMDTIQFAYKNSINQIVFTSESTEEYAIEIPIEVTRDLSNSVLYYKPILHIIDQLYLSSSDAYFKTLFPTIPSHDLYDLLKKYSVFMEPKENSISFKNIETETYTLYDLDKNMLFVNDPNVIFYYLSQTNVTISLNYHVSINDYDIETNAPTSLINILKPLLSTEKASMSSYKNQLDIQILQENETRFINKLQKILHDYLHKHPRKKSSDKQPEQPILFQPTSSQRSNPKYFVIDTLPTNPTFSIPNETLQHGDILGWKKDEQRVWFYIRPSLEKEGTFQESYINQYSTLYIPIEVTQHLEDSIAYYKPLLKDLKLMKADTIRIIISPNDILWKNKKIFKPEVIKKVGHILDFIRQHHTTFIDYSIDYTLREKNRSKGYIWIKENPNSAIFTRIVYGAPVYISKNIIKNLLNLYWDPKPIEITIDLWIETSKKQKIQINNVYNTEQIKRLFPHSQFEWSIEQNPKQPPKLIVKVPQYLKNKIQGSIENLFQSEDGWLPFGSMLKF